MSEPDRAKVAAAQLNITLAATRELVDLLLEKGFEPVAILAAFGEMSAVLIGHSDPHMRGRVLEKFQECFKGALHEHAGL